MLEIEVLGAKNFKSVCEGRRGFKVKVWEKKVTVENSFPWLQCLNLD